MNRAYNTTSHELQSHHCSCHHSSNCLRNDLKEELIRLRQSSQDAIQKSVSSPVNISQIHPILFLLELVVINPIIYLYSSYRLIITILLTLSIVVRNRATSTRKGTPSPSNRIPQGATVTVQRAIDPIQETK